MKLCVSIKKRDSLGQRVPTTCIGDGFFLCAGGVEDAGRVRFTTEVTGETQRFTEEGEEIRKKGNAHFTK